MKIFGVPLKDISSLVSNDPMSVLFIVCVSAFIIVAIAIMIGCAVEDLKDRGYW